MSNPIAHIKHLLQHERKMLDEVRDEMMSDPSTALEYKLKFSEHQEACMFIMGLVVLPTPSENQGELYIGIYTYI